MADLTTHKSRLARQAPRRVVLSPSAFADDYETRPTADVAVGLRVISEADVQSAKAQSSRKVFDELYLSRDDKRIDTEKAIEAWNDHLVRFVVSRALCDVNDVTKGYFQFEDEAGRAFTSATFGKLWDELDILTTSVDPTGHRITDLELAELAAVIDVIPSVTPKAKQLRIRRLAGELLNELAPRG
jgi:hypothetical protein